MSRFVPTRPARRGQSIYLHRIATAVPAHRLPQTQILEFMRRWHDHDAGKTAFLERIYAGSAINQRHSVIADYGLPAGDHDFYPRSGQPQSMPGTAARNARYAAEAPRLAANAARSLFEDPSLHVDPRTVTHLVTVSCTGFNAPGFDLPVIEKLGLHPAVKRTHIGFMGCNAAFPALNLAAEACAADPTARVLIISVELCTLHFQPTWNPEQVVANALFADGAAAVLVSANPADSAVPWFGLGPRSSRLVPDSAGRMAWTIGDHGFEMILSAYVPKLIESELGPIIDGMLESCGQTRGSIRHWAIHPGGRAILDRVSQGLDLPAGALDASRAILRDYGNMSSATMFFLLRQLAHPSPATRGSGGLVFATAFGPGLSIESALLELQPRPPKTRHAWFLPNLAERSFQPELMDDPAIDSRRLERTIRQFRQLNRLFSGYRPILREELFARIAAIPPGAVPPEYSVLDIGCGGGDILVWLAREARRRGIRLRLTGIDPDRRTVEWARSLVGAWPEITIIQAAHTDLPQLGGFDFIISNHVLHHLRHREIASLVALAQRHARINLILNDLARSRWAYLGYTIFTGLFVRRSLAFFDGRLSIRRGFRRSELEDAIKDAGLPASGPDSLAVRFRHPARLYTSRPEGSAQQMLQQDLDADTDQHQTTENLQTQVDPVAKPRTQEITP